MRSERKQRDHEVAPRTRHVRDFTDYVPVHVIWEITLACDLKCLHCGSRAGRRRSSELSTTECLDIVESLARLGTQEISLIGGEAYLRRDWTEIIRRARSHGIHCAVQTGGRNLTPERLSAAVDTGLSGLGVSLDGLAPLHDRVRNVKGSFDRASDLLRRAHETALVTSVNTQIGPDTPDDLPALMDHIIALGATNWQLQLTVAMGNAVDHDELILQPFRLLDLMPLLARLYREGRSRGLAVNVGNNIGYFGPFEHVWRGFGNDRVHWSGCSAGHTTLALEADGTVKGCPSLATTDFAGGNVRDLTIEEIWHSSEAVHFGRLRSSQDLWGFCGECYYADICRAGCTWTSHSLLGLPGNNPYCHYRALEMDKRGLREQVVKIRDADNKPFAIGAFDLVTERLDDGTVVSSTASGDVARPAPRTSNKAPERGRVPPVLDICRACNGYIREREIVCPHCRSDVAVAAAMHAEAVTRRTALMTEIERQLAPARGR